MVKGKPNKNRLKASQKRTRKARVRRDVVLQQHSAIAAKLFPNKDPNKTENMSVNMHPKDNTSVEHSYDMPVISAVHGKDYFESHPFCESQMKSCHENEVYSKTGNHTIIKIESCEVENDLHEEINNSALSPVPEMLPEQYLKDHNVCSEQMDDSGCELSPMRVQIFSRDRENELLIEIIKYLDGCTKIDKFDLAGKLYASKLRSVIFTNQQAMAENLCRQVLLEAEHFNLDEKIVLTKQHPSDYLGNKKNRINVANKEDSKQFSYHQLKKGALLQNIQNRLLENAKDDRFDKFGKFYAIKMRSFSDIQYFYADKLINEIVLEAELCRLRANYKLGKLGDPPSPIFTTGQSYSKKCQSQIADSSASNSLCADSNTLPKQSDQKDNMNLPPHTFATKQSSIKKSHPKVSNSPLSSDNNKIPPKNCHSNLLVSNAACAISKSPLKQSDQHVKTLRKSVKQYKRSKSIDKTSFGSLVSTPDVVSTKHNMNHQPKLMCSSVSKTFISKHSPKIIFDKNVKNDPVTEKISNSSFKSSVNVRIPTPDVRNDNHESLTFSLPSNVVLETPNSKKERKSLNKGLQNNSIKADDNFSLELSVPPLTPDLSVNSSQKNAYQLSQTLPPIPNTSSSCLLSLLTFNQICHPNWRGEMSHCSM